MNEDDQGQRPFNQVMNFKWITFPIDISYSKLCPYSNIQPFLCVTGLHLLKQGCSGHLIMTSLRGTFESLTAIS